MAEINVEEVKIDPIVKINLELTLQEASDLYALFNHIGGDPEKFRCRNITDKLASKLGNLILPKPTTPIRSVFLEEARPGTRW